jgi:GNAT superfamily N-acetyltransferase
MQIRRVKLTEGNIELLNALDRTCFPGDDLYGKQGAEWWVGYDDAVVGCFAGLKNVGHSTGFLCRAGVLKEARGKGLHRRLIRIRETRARETGLEWMITYVAPYNLKSANNLIACGYKLYNPQNPYGVTGALYFRKKL